MKPYSSGKELFTGRSTVWATVGSMRCTTRSRFSCPSRGAGYTTAIEDAAQTSGSPSAAFVSVCATRIVGISESSGHVTSQRHGIGAEARTSAFVEATRASHGTKVPSAGCWASPGNQKPDCFA